MKEQAIQKINTIGKVSSIIALIAKILVGIGLAATIAGAVICLVLPQSLLTMNTQTALEFVVDYSFLGLEMTDAEIAEAMEQMEMEMVLPNDETEGFTDIEMTAEHIIMKGDVEDFSIDMRVLACALFIVAVSLVMTLVTLVFIGSLCKAFRDCQSPFEENVIKKMQNLAYSLIPWALIATITNTISDSIMNNKPSIMLSIDFGVILVVLLVLVLVYIFKYGAVLQQESDETL